MRSENATRERRIGIVLLASSIVVSLGIAEVALRCFTDAGLADKKLWISTEDNAGHPALAAVLSECCRDFPFQWGNCYPTDPTGLLPIAAQDPQTGQSWHCVAYDLGRRRAGYNPERKFQAVIVGDSFAFGEGVKETDTLGYLLNQKLPDVNFLNYGVSGGDIADVVATCERTIRSRRDIRSITYFYNINDVLLSEEVGNQQKYIIDFQNIRWSNDEQRQGPITKLLSTSRLYAWSRRALVMHRESVLTTRNYRDMYFSRANRSEFVETMNAISWINDLARSQGVSFLVVLYPLMHKDLSGAYPFEDIHDAIMSACRERNVPCLDGYEPFRKLHSLKPYRVNPLDYHPNGLGNRKVVDYLHGTGSLHDTGGVDGGSPRTAPGAETPPDRR